MADSREYAVAGETYTNIFSLVPAGGGDVFQASPTISAGDFTISTDDGATFTSMENLPVVAAGNNKIVSYTLSAAETAAAGAGGLAIIQAHDPDGEWQDMTISLPVRGEDLATPADIQANNNSIADAVLKRGVSNVELEADEHSLAALTLAAFKSDLTQGLTWRIFRTDGELFATKSITTATSALPIIKID